MDKILPIEHKIFRKRKFDVLKPVPCFSSVYPSDIKIYGMDKTYINPKYNDITNVNDPIL